MDENNELHLTDLIDINTLQMIQDAFSDLTGMAALTTDKNGIAVTDGSNFTDLCMRYTRTSEVGKHRCEICDRKGAEMALANGKFCSYYCHAGLVDYAAPIMANGEMVGSFIGGQVLTESPDLKKFENTARELGVDPDKYVEAVKKIKIIDKELVDKASHFLYVIAVVLSNIAYRSYELDKSRHEAEKASHVKSDFLANMSHEIRTPMNAVIGLADLALREEMSSSAREYIHQVKASSHNLLVIINDILDFSKIESGKMDIVEVEYEPLSLVNDLTGIVNSRIGDKDIEFIMDIAPDLPQNLYGDNIRIHQIILNLLTNAVKFTNHGEVRLEMSGERQNEDTVIIKVAICDTGIGIKKNDMKKLFNSFQQVDSKRNRNIEGTGLGLAISQQLLHLMHGKISVESEYEKGTKFFFELPQKIINDSSAVPVLDKPLAVAVLVENKYVYNQLIKDLKRIGADYIDLSENGSLEDLTTDFIIVDKAFFTQSIQQYLDTHPDVYSLVLNEYDNMEPIDMSNVRVISKPVYSLSLYNALGITDVDMGGDSGSEAETFTFVAPDAHILVVDDNTVNLTVAKGLLEPLSMQIEVASSAAEAIEKIHDTKFDLIFMDHMMPEVDGIEATHIIRRLMPEYQNVPIIALTANAVGGAKEMFIEEGMNDFVAKPIEIKDIVSKLRKWLPKEKITPIDKSDASRGSVQDIPQYSSGSHEPDSIMKIKELDTQQALKLLGNEKLFRTVLKEYFCAIEKKHKTILDHKEAGRWRDYTIEVHSLKSTSKQIGANLVSSLAAEMEKAGNDGDIDLINEKTDRMLSEYLKFKDILAPYFPECAEVEEEKPQETEDLLRMLEQMQVALDNFDTLQIEEALEAMESFKFTDDQLSRFEKLKEAAMNTDFETCNRIIEEWGTSIMEMGEDEKHNAVQRMLEKMQHALAEFDTLEIEDAMDEMSKFSYSGEQEEYFNDLKSAVESSDIDRCNEIIEKWMGHIAAAVAN
ncbi:MAG: PocR ligand-binding domain-containing protein [Oscillospiraceae bacterium]|nr:PocR ligand-binding domain-containing protein [Oscillospiraceae bacterium]